MAICGYRIAAIMSPCHGEDGGSTPPTRSKEKSPPRVGTFLCVWRRREEIGEVHSAPSCAQSRRSGDTVNARRWLPPLGARPPGPARSAGGLTRSKKSQKKSAASLRCGGTAYLRSLERTSHRPDTGWNSRSNPSGMAMSSSVRKRSPTCRPTTWKRVRSADISASTASRPRSPP